MILNLVLLKDSGGYPQLGVLNLWKGRKSEIYFNLLDQKPVIFGSPSFFREICLVALQTGDYSNKYGLGFITHGK